MKEGLNQPPAESLGEALKKVSEFINKRQWSKAAQQAENVTQHWPQSLAAWKQRYLVALLLNDQQGYPYGATSFQIVDWDWI